MLVHILTVCLALADIRLTLVVKWEDSNNAVCCPVFSLLAFRFELHFLRKGIPGHHLIFAIFLSK